MEQGAKRVVSPLAFPVSSYSSWAFRLPPSPAVALQCMIVFLLASGVCLNALSHRAVRKSRKQKLPWAAIVRGRKAQSPNGEHGVDRLIATLRCAGEFANP